MKTLNETSLRDCERPRGARNPNLLLQTHARLLYCLAQARFSTTLFCFVRHKVSQLYHGYKPRLGYRGEISTTFYFRSQNISLHQEPNMFHTLILIIILMRNSLQLSTKFCDIFINPEALSNRPRPHLLTLGYYYFIYTSAPDLFTVPLPLPPGATPQTGDNKFQR